MPGRIDIDAEDIPVLDQVSPKAPEGAGADYSAVRLLGGHWGVCRYQSQSRHERTRLEQ